MNLQIQTTQNVAITFEPADPVTRCWAGLIDLLVGVAYIFAVIMVLSSYFTTAHLRESTMITIVLIASLPYFLYDFLSEVFMNGQSFGKRAMKIRVMRLDGTEPRIGDYALRWLIGLIEFKLTTCSLAALALLFSRSGQRLGDRVAGTTVVKVAPQARLRDTIYSNVNPNYNPTYPSAEHLEPEVLELIREVIRDRDLRNDRQVVRTLATAVRDRMEVTPAESPLDFLRVVLKDYNALHGATIESVLDRAQRPAPQPEGW